MASQSCDFAVARFSGIAPYLRDIPLIVRSHGRCAGDYGKSFWQDHVFNVAHQLGIQHVYLFVDPSELDLYAALVPAAASYEVHIVERCGDHLGAVEDFIAKYWFQHFGCESIVLQANDDLHEVVDNCGNSVAWADVGQALQQLVRDMVLHGFGLAGFYPTAAFMVPRRQGDVTEYGNLFVIEHLCLRVIHQRRRMSPCWSKIDLERSAVAYMCFGGVARMKSLHATTARNMGGGCGDIKKRPEQEDCDTLLKLYPQLFSSAKQMKSGQWTLKFKPFLPVSWTSASAIVAPPEAGVGKNTREGKKRRLISLDDLSDSSLAEHVGHVSQPAKLQALLAALEDALKVKQLALQATSLHAFGKRLGKVGWQMEHSKLGNTWCQPA
jgi:hypothetical protein